MNKALRYLVLATMVVGTVSADNSTNKTFMNGRSTGTNLTTWYGAGIQEIVNRKDKDKFGGTFFATGFYTDGDMAAQYWTPANKNGFLLTETDLPVIFSHATDKMTFDPSQKTYGATLAYDQRLDSILKGLFFNVQLPIVNVENDLGLTVAGNDKAIIENFLAGKAPVVAKSYLAKVANVYNSVATLNYARIDGDNSTTGIADIDVRIGYNFLNKCKYHAGLNLGLTIPTGSDAEGVTLNEAIVGNGDHFGLGGGLTFDARIWGDVEHNFIVYGDLKYRYLFEASEVRTLGLKDWNFAHYLPLVKHVAAADIANNSLDVVPAANVLTHAVDVTPGSEFDGIVALAYNNGGFGANLGYNLYFRESESVELKGTNPLKTDVWSYIWADGLTGATHSEIIALTETDLVMTNAETPSQVSHKIFGGLAWTFKNWETPVNVGVGGHYEFMDDREGYENWGINARLGIGF